MSLFLHQKPLLSPAAAAADAPVARFVASLRALSDAALAEASTALAGFGDEDRRRALGDEAKGGGFLLGKMGKNWGFWGKHVLFWDDFGGISWSFLANFGDFWRIEWK